MGCESISAASYAASPSRSVGNDSLAFRKSALPARLTRVLFSGYVPLEAFLLHVTKRSHGAVRQFDARIKREFHRLGDAHPVVSRPPGNTGNNSVLPNDGETTGQAAGISFASPLHVRRIPCVFPSIGRQHSISSPAAAFSHSSAPRYDHGSFQVVEVV